jgi:hypothetical protein
VAPSPLAVHELVLEHLDQAAAGPLVLVVLTDREETELDPAVLARVHRQRIEVVDSWEVVREAFGGSGVDPRLREANWAAEALLDATPPGGWPRLPGGQLSRQPALTSLALRRLRLGPYDDERGTGKRATNGRLDIATLLQWSTTPGGPDRLLSLRGPERTGLRAFLGEPEQGGPAAETLIALIEAGHGEDAVAFGIVCAALWTHAEADAETYRARGRAERWLGEHPPASGEQLDALVVAFGQACEEYVASRTAAARHASDGESARIDRRAVATILDRAGTLSRQFGAESAAGASRLLAAGLEARFAAAGRALSAGDERAITAAVDALGDHQLVREPDAEARFARVRMAQRLTRWLASNPAATSPNVAAGLDRHIAETAWVDRALDHLDAGGDHEAALSEAYARIGVEVRKRRREIDQAFAHRLAAWTEAGTPPGGMLVVEDFLRTVVEPIVKHAGDRRILLLVVDGMSAAIACELAEELRRDWAEYDPLPAGSENQAPRRRAMAAALPTLTAVSRTSLFAARLTTGGQADEKRLFPAHRFWGSSRALVFHKDDLRADDSGDVFSPALADALGDDRTHVAVVLNTIDDRLAKEQKLGAAEWRIDEIGKLRDLLRVAAHNGMAILLTSDHGHVVDRRGLKAEAAEPGSARHRAPGGVLAENEVALSGPRVLSPEQGASIVALWDADSRYTARKAGYHGGASLAEVTIPVLAFLPFNAEPPRHWRELGDPRPAWWTNDGESTSVAPPSPRRTATRSKREQRAPGADALFEIEMAPGDDGALITPKAVTGSDALVRELLASAIFDAQLELLARKPPQDKIGKAVSELLEAGGTLPATALAQRVAYPTSRADGFAAVLRQVLNYDGIQVLETLPDGRTLRLNRQLLRDQFELRAR